MQICNTCYIIKILGGDFIYYHDEITRNFINLGYCISCTETADFDLHCHSNYEIYFFLNGDVSYLVEGKEYTLTPYSLLLLAPNVFHGVRINSKTPYERYALHFPHNIIEPYTYLDLLSSFKENKQIHFENLFENNFSQIFDDIINSKNLPKDLIDMTLNIRIQNLLTHILALNKNNISQSTSTIHPLINDIIIFLNQNITSNISLDMLATKFFISKHYLNALFKKHTGTTVMNYIIHKRIALASEMLSQNIPANIVSEKLGFGDYSVFFKAYKKIYGFAPTHQNKI